MANKPLSSQRVRKKAELIAQDILRDIVVRNLVAGDGLAPEAEMLREYGVARGSLREALRILEVQGIIALRTGSKGGPVVCEVGPAEFGQMAALYFQATHVSLNDLLEARRVIEAVMAQIAAQERRPELLEQLEELAERMKTVDLEHASPEYTETAMEFHRIICGFSSNGVLNLIGGGLIEAFMGRVIPSAFQPELRHQAMSEHRAVIKAILDGDSKKAYSLMGQHMSHYASNQININPLEQMIEWQ